MLSNEAVDLAQFVAPKAAAAFQANRVEPEFGHIVVSFNVDVRRFVAFVGEKEEAVGTQAEDGRHHNKEIMACRKVAALWGVRNHSCTRSFSTLGSVCFLPVAAVRVRDGRRRVALYVSGARGGGEVQLLITVLEKN